MSLISKTYCLGFTCCVCLVNATESTAPVLSISLYNVYEGFIELLLMGENGWISDEKLIVSAIRKTSRTPL